MVTVKIQMLIRRVPDSVERRAEHVDHAGEDVVARDERPPFE